MKSFFSLIIVLLNLLHVSAQLSVNPAKIEFGIITRESDRVVDILVQNNGAIRDYLLRTTFNHEYEVLYTSKTLEPGGTIVIRIQFNPREKGPHRDVVELYFASMKEPILLPITAQVEFADPTGGNACPDFGQREAECCTNNMFLVEVIDKESGHPIERAQVRVEEQGYVQLNLLTNEEGRVTQQARIGFYEIIAEKKGYNRASLHSYVNKRNYHFVLELERNADFKPEDGLIIPPADTTEYVVETEEDILPESAFKPNNIVFLLDISGSMGKHGKLELMKASLVQLISILRPVDKVALLSYADEAKTLLPVTTGDQKGAILLSIDSLEARGVTSGGKGFRRSFTSLRKSFIKGGNNQLIVITDGAFKPEDQEAIEKLVRQATRKGIQTSIVAIRPDSYAREKLSLVSDLGNGSFLQVENLSDTRHILIEEVKKRSAR